jgi:hypothetical protein
MVYLKEEKQMKKKLLNSAIIVLFAGLIALFAFEPVGAATITVDGDTSDWSGISALGEDSRDMDNPNIDLKAGYATNDSANLYLRIDVYGEIDRSTCWYYVYFDTDRDTSSGFKSGWCGIGADYRIYIDQWVSCIQEFMGQTQEDDVWGWNGEVTSVKSIDIGYNDYTLECAVSRKDIKETASPETTDILWVSWADSHDFIPGHHKKGPITYNYSKSVNY